MRQPHGLDAVQPRGTDDYAATGAHSSIAMVQDRRVTGLPRRVFFGIRLAPREAAFSARGAHVFGTLEGSAAALAGITQGDVIARVGDVQTVSPHAWLDASRRAASFERVALHIERDGCPRTIDLPITAWPGETFESSNVDYGHVESRGARLRTIVSTPRDSGRRRSPAMLYLQGIGCDSVEIGAASRTPMRELVHGLARAGFVTMRLEKPGVGDSEGGPAFAVDFETELDAFRAALVALLGRSDVDRSAVFLFGHSVGALVAALLAAEVDVRGLVVYGATAGRWSDDLEATTRRQLALRGSAPAEIERAVARQRAAFETDDDGAAFLGRTIRYHRQLAKIDVPALWRRIDEPLLVLHGEHDWVVGDDAPDDIRRNVPDGRAHVVELAGLDHAMTRHASLADSLAALGAGEVNETLASVIVEWVQARLARSDTLAGRR